VADSIDEIVGAVIVNERHAMIDTADVGMIGVHPAV
jgi:hypothetical protein